MTTAAWFIAFPDHTEGPISREELLRRLVRRPSPRDVLVWREGEAAWAPPDDVPDLAEARVAPWFAVGRAKLVVMSVATLGLYEIYWFYKQWKRVRETTSDTVHPVLGAIFSGLSGFWLFKRVHDAADEAGVAVSWSGGALAAGYLALSLLWRLPDPFWLLSFLSVVPVAIVQGAANAVNERRAPLAARNDSFTAANWIGALVGGFLLLLGVIGTFLPAA